MVIGNDTDHAGEWLRASGPQGDVVISSRVRLARNVAGFPFVSKSSLLQRTEVMDRCRKALTAKSLSPDAIWVDLRKADELDRMLLVERHLISRQHAMAGDDFPRAVAVDPDETFGVMVNEEDHVRIQVMRCGLQLQQAFEQADAIDDALEGQIDFAYSQRFGYLTACPTNVGTGLRVSVMLHLPALKLTGEIEKVRRAARDMHLAVRGLFGEGSDALGDLFQISNQTTFGKSEQETLADFENNVIPPLIAYEHQARQALLQQRKSQLDDKIFRAWGILTHARTIGTEEVLTLLSHLRLGVNLGRMNLVDVRTINELFILTQPAHLQKRIGKVMETPDRREARATTIRQRLGFE